jgi:4-hydroxybenzoate polyprenyltransferase
MNRPTAPSQDTEPQAAPSAATVAPASLGRDDGFGYTLLAMFALGCASAAVYLVNDVADVFWC